MEMIFLGIALAFNVLVILYKYSKDRFLDAVLDFGILATLSLVFGQTITGLIIVTYASAIISVILYFYLKKPKQAT